MAEIIIPDVPRNLDPYATRYFEVLRQAILDLQERIQKLEEESV